MYYWGQVLCSRRLKGVYLGPNGHRTRQDRNFCNAQEGSLCSFRDKLYLIYHLIPVYDKASLWFKLRIYDPCLYRSLSFHLQSRIYLSRKQPNPRNKFLLS